MTSPDPEFSTSTQALQPSTEVTFASITQLHDKFQAFVLPLAKNCGSQWRLYVTAGGVRTRVASGTLANVGVTEAIAAQIIQWSGDGTFQADGGTLFELVGFGDPGSTAQCRATLAGFDYSTFAAETIANGTQNLTPDGNEVVLATLNAQFQFLNCYVDASNIRSRTRFKLYATADALANPPGPRVLVRTVDFDPNGQLFGTIPLFQTNSDGNGITSIGANKYELVAQNLSGIGNPSVSGALGGRYSQAVGATIPILTLSFNALPANGLETIIGAIPLTQSITYFFRCTYEIRDTVNGKGQVTVLRVTIQGDPAGPTLISATSEFNASNLTSGGVVNARIGAGPVLNLDFTNNIPNNNPVNVKITVEEFFGPTS